ncbi:MAG: hypothetical protein MZW92_16775 [Comamonadaceae bacterium]|nr:hypothetical protein [Comamonadaceae bacterium]
MIDSWADFLKTDANPCLLVAPLDHGLYVTNPTLAITETQLSGEKVQQRRRRRRSAERDPSILLRDLAELEIGAPVVHQDHGVGRYLGLQRLSVGGRDTEFLTLEYANQDKLYVPVSALHLISRYSGASPESASAQTRRRTVVRRLKRPGSRRRARDAAAELLEVYARREARQGHAYQALDQQQLHRVRRGLPLRGNPGPRSRGPSGR